MCMILTGLFVFVVAIIWWMRDNRPLTPQLAEQGAEWTAGAFIVAFIAAIALMLSRGKARNTANAAETVEQMRAAGKIVDTTYTATRAFLIHEYEDEGPHYFIELVDGKVIYVTGQTLYEYEPDFEEGAPRRFPCTDFTIAWHDGYAIDIQCRGDVIEPFAEFDVEDDDVESFADIMSDGKATIDKSLDELVASIKNPPQKPAKKRLFG